MKITEIKNVYSVIPTAIKTIEFIKLECVDVRGD
jgi:hypothetical protein